MKETAKNYIKLSEISFFVLIMKETNSKLQLFLSHDWFNFTICQNFDLLFPNGETFHCDICATTHTKLDTQN